MSKQPYISLERHIELSSLIKKQTNMSINFKPSQDVMKNLIGIVYSKVSGYFPEDSELMDLLKRLKRLKRIKQYDFEHMISLLDVDYSYYPDKIYMKYRHIYYN